MRTLAVSILPDLIAKHVKFLSSGSTSRACALEQRVAHLESPVVALQSLLMGLGLEEEACVKEGCAAFVSYNDAKSVDPDAKFVNPDDAGSVNDAASVSHVVAKSVDPDAKFVNPDEWAALGAEKIVAGRSDLFTDLPGSLSAPACF